MSSCGRGLGRTRRVSKDPEDSCISNDRSRRVDDSHSLEAGGATPPSLRGPISAREWRANAKGLRLLGYAPFVSWPDTRWTRALATRPAIAPVVPVTSPIGNSSTGTPHSASARPPLP